LIPAGIFEIHRLPQECFPEEDNQKGLSRLLISHSIYKMAGKPPSLILMSITLIKVSVFKPFLIMSLYDIPFREVEIMPVSPLRIFMERRSCFVVSQKRIMFK
jgi:hypothetical protein